MAPQIVERAGAAGRLAVGFGCNDGVLMRPLAAARAKVLGVDPSDVALRASLAQDRTNAPPPPPTRPGHYGGLSSAGDVAPNAPGSAPTSP